MLRDEMELYSKLTGEDGTHVPIMKLGAYLDGYEKGLSVLDDIKAEIKVIQEAEIQIYGADHWNFVGKCLDIIDKHMESEDNK